MDTDNSLLMSVLMCHLVILDNIWNAR